MVNKRGQGYTDELMIFTIIAPLFAIALGIGMFMYASSNADLTAYWLDFYSKDIGLTMDSVYGVNGNIEMTYSVRSPEHYFMYDIEEGIVTVQEEENPGLPAKFHFAKSLFVSLKDKATLYRTFPIIREENKVYFEEQEATGCNYIKTTDSNYKTKKHYFGFLNDARPASQNMVESLRQYAGVNSIRMTDDKANADFAIYFSDLDSETTRIYYSAIENAEAKKLACILKNEIGEYHPIIVKPIYPSADFKVLKTKPSLVIELGTRKQTESLLIPITKALEEYYK